jgi:hypothetical protein
MNSTTQTLLSQEWQTLHQDHERYDRYGLLIKLTAALACLLTIALTMNLLLALAFVLVLWLQEGIWRTVQARTSARLLVIERILKDPTNHAAMQFYSEWEASRPGTKGLIKEYLHNAVRPTVAYPYVILLGLQIVATTFIL